MGTCFFEGRLLGLRLVGSGICECSDIDDCDREGLDIDGSKSSKKTSLVSISSMNDDSL